MKTLYKKDSKGKIREWTICTIDDELIQKSGIVDGKLVEHNKLCKSKNVGKSNSTTGSEQAILEMESLIKSKLSEGYFNTKDEAENEVVILPMLASDYNKFSKKIDWNNCYIQPKLDGMRCLAHVSKDGHVKLVSRDGKDIFNMEHICNDLFTIGQDVILDGELYAHGLSFQENMKLIKKKRKETFELIKFHIYDTVSDNNYITRKNIIDSIRWKDLNSIVLVETYKMVNEIQLKINHSVFIQDGYEGSIVRHGNKPYELDKRSTSLLKYKDFQDIDAEIIDITSNDSNPLHGTPLLKYNSSTFKAGVKMSHEDRIDLLAKKHLYIGKLANIRFFEWTDDGNPRFPVMIGIHLDR